MKKCIECQTPFSTEDWRCPSCGFEPDRQGKWPTFAKDMIDAGPKEFGDDTYARMSAIEKNSFYCHSRLRLLQWAFRRFFPDATNFYDFGAGTGYVLQGLRSIKPGLKLYGSDLSLDSLAWVDTLLGGDVDLFHTDAERIPYQEHFDVIGAFDVVEHIENDARVLGLLNQAVKPGGGVILTVPQHMVLWSRLDDETGHRRRYVGNELARKARDAGFDVVLDTCFMGTLFVPQYISRRWLVSRSGKEGFEGEHSLPGPINAFLKGILAVELMLVRAGIRIPFGGMRIVVARRA